MKFNKEFKVGLLTITAIVLLIWGYNFLKGKNYFSPTHSYFVIYDEIGGLKVSNQVMIQGYSAGRVKGITLDTDRKKVIVEIEVERSIQLGDKTAALLADDGFLGGKIIHLKTDKEKAYFEPGDTLFSKTDEGIADMVKSKADPLVRSLDSTLNKVSALLDEYRGLSSDVRKILSNVNEASGSLNGILKENRGSLNGVMKNLDEMTASLVQTEKKLAPLIDKFDVLAADLKSAELGEMSKNLNANLLEIKGITSSINKGEGTVGLLIKTDSVHRRVDSLLLNLNSLLTDLQKQPKKYIPPISVFPKKDKEKKKKK
jgi:phospholipid/cholesterol/gamma-HCH transport system substrate-binding protein